MRNCFGNGKTAVFLSVAFLLFSLTLSAQEQDGYHQVIGLIHMDSSISGGDNSPEMLAAVAKNAGASVGILTDHDTQKVTYGIWPLRNVLKASYSRDSIRTYGIAKYLNDVAEINRTTKNFVFLPGIEAVPYYHWGKGADGHLQLRDLHRHILVFGLDKSSQIAQLPSIEAGYSSYYTMQSFMGLLWLAPFLAALFVITLPRGQVNFRRGGVPAIHSISARVMAVPVLVFSLLMLINSYPFQARQVDQYRPDMRQIPYQQMIDYVNSQDGLTFWAHPEAHFKETIGEETGSRLVTFFIKTFLGGGLTVETEPYYTLLNDTHDYTGFSIFFEGYRIVGKPEGLWDDLLMQFCAGTRNRPVWAIAELEMDAGTSPELASESQTVFLVRGETRKDYLDALRNGRMYCYTGNINRNLTIREYSAVSGDVRAISGEILPCGRDARFILDLEMSSGPTNLEVILVRDGTIFQHEYITGSKRFEIPLLPPDGDMGYMRAVIMRSGEMVAATNPIFLRKAGRF